MQHVQVIQEMPGPQKTLWLQCLFLFSLVWSVGGNTDAGGRATINEALRRVVDNDIPPGLKLFATGKALKINQMFPDARSVYDCMFDKSKSKWVFWLDTVEAKALDCDAEYSNIVVPTVDTIRSFHLYFIHRTRESKWEILSRKHPSKHAQPCPACQKASSHLQHSTLLDFSAKAL
jgi:hypothetical protein